MAWNRLLSAQGDARANAFADAAERAFRQDEALTDAYHRLNGGKWDGMMAQTHIGYTYWNDPPKQTMPAVQRTVPVEGRGTRTEIWHAAAGGHCARHQDL